MASLNTAARELVLKIVYYGPGLGGKTTSLQAVHESAPPERRGQLVSLATPVDRTLYFDFLPLRLPPMRGMSVRLQLFTVPGQVYFNATRRLVLSGADGIVFVADSQADRVDSNLESLENLRDNLAEHGRDLAHVPHVFAWNKRDLESAVSVDELSRLLNRHGAPAFETVATRSTGVQEALAKITSMVLDAYESQLPQADAAAPPASLEPATVAERSPLARGDERHVVTSAPKPGGPVSLTHAEAEVVTSAQLLSPNEGTFLADLGQIEAEVKGASAAPEDVRGGKESVVGEWVPDVEPSDESAADDGATAEPKPSAGRGTLRGGAGLHGNEAKAFTFAQLFSPAERALAEQIETTIAHGDFADAIGVCEAALSRILGRIAHAIDAGGARGGADASIAVLLGLEGRRYLTFRALAKRARDVGDVGARDALEAYSFLLEARVLTSHWEALRDAVGAGSLPPPARAPLPASDDDLTPLPKSSLSPPSTRDQLPRYGGA